MALAQVEVHLKVRLPVRHTSVFLGTLRAVELILGRAVVKEPLLALPEKTREYVVNPVKHYTLIIQTILGKNKNGLHLRIIRCKSVICIYLIVLSENLYPKCMVV